MTEYELMKFARKGAEFEIRHECTFISECWPDPRKLEKLGTLLFQYREIMDRYEAARDADSSDD